MKNTTPRILAAALLGLSASFAAEKPVKVYILAGQSNMVGIGQVDGGGLRWGNEFSAAVLSIYEGTPDVSTDYDQMPASPFSTCGY